ncbi:MAG: oligopeptide transporter, OPT family [Pseudomonadota bacterium]
MENTFKPYVPAQSTMKELTFKAVFLGLLLAVILGAANAYLGLKAGMTISAAFPAAVIAIAAFRLPFLRGTVLEQNIARTTASVGEALVAGAIFTIPAFVIVSVDGQRLWTNFHYWDVAMITLVGGLIGVLFVILLRKTLVVDANLPFPEGYACYEIVKSGQGGESGAKYVFGALGLGVLIEMLKNSGGFAIFQECKEYFIHFPKSIIHHFNGSKEPLADIAHKGGVAFQSPLASPALMSVGYIIGPKYACINFAGGVLAWLVFIPLALFLNPDFMNQLTAAGATVTHKEMAYTAWYNLIRPIAVGAMLVASLYTLWGLKSSLAGAFRGIFTKHAHAKGGPNRLEKDLNPRWVFIAAITLIIPMAFLYYYFCDNVTGAIVAAIVMLITAFLFAAVGGWLVGLVGNSNQPVSGLTLSTLIIAALVMLMFGVKGLPGIAAVLGVAAVVCCVACLAGDMIQDLKVGQLIGGTPWKMQVSEILGVVVVAFVLVFPIIILHEGNIAAGGIGIGDAKLPAPQAGLMAQLATGIVGGNMPWGLIITGMFFAVSLILVKAPAPMLIAVGMYLPFETTFAIFIGGVMKWFVDFLAKKRGIKGEGMEGKGILLASGFIAGEALTGVILAGLVLVGIPSLSERFLGVSELPILESHGGWLSLIIFGVVALALIGIPLRKKT